MARRRNRWSEPEKSAAIGDTHVDAAVEQLKRTAATAVSIMTAYSLNAEQTMSMLFRDEELAKVRAAKGLVTPRSTVGNYTISPEVTLGFELEETSLLPLEDTRLHFQSDRIGPLLSFIRDVKHVHDQYEAVKAVLRWLNRNATPGGIRYYWPSALQLCPKAPAFADLQHVPVRYSTPSGLAERTQLLKDTAATVAGSLMLPSDAKPRERKTMWLTFDATRVQVPSTNDVSYMSDRMTYNI